MCMKNVVRRFGAFLSALVLCFSLTVPALADELYDGSVGFVIAQSQSTYSSRVTFGSSVSSGSTSVSFLNPSETDGIAFCYVDFNADTAGLSVGSLGYYLSFFYYSKSTGAVQSKIPVASDFGIVGGVLGGSSVRGTVSLTRFAPTSSFVSMSDGVSLVGRISSSSGDPFRAQVSLFQYGYDWGYSSKPFSFVPVSGSFPANDAGMYITSFRVVTSGSSEELDAIEDMASNISAQNQILSAFYGDIVAVCNQIYQRLGDLQAAQEEANALFSSVISLLNSTNSKLDSINQAMSTYFELVLKSLQNESLSIQDCINDAELRLETYLKPIVDYFTELEETTGESASSLPQHKTDLDKWSSDSTGIDADAQTGLAAILPVLTAFSFIFQILSIFIGLGILGVIIRKGLS